MKKVFLVLALALGLSSCEKPVISEDGSESVEMTTNNSRKFTWKVKGDFSTVPETRAAGLIADGKEMTDLWTFDYMDGELVQQLHQSSSDADWGSPSLRLLYGSHHVYFVASRGNDAVADIDKTVLVWGTTRDTFWKDYAVDVISTSNGSRVVTLDRVATRLKVTIMDEVPENCAKMALTATKWFNGIDYTTGKAIEAPAAYTSSVAVPAAYVGTSGKMSITMYGLSDADEWTTALSIDALDASDKIIGHAEVEAAPFERNRSTEYSGSLFTTSGGWGTALNDEWSTAYTSEW